jgi:hypothetical protein
MKKAAIAAGALLAVGLLLLGKKTMATTIAQLTPEARKALAAQIAAELGTEPAVIRAFLQVESSGKAFALHPDGIRRMIIRFEPHIFRRYTEQHTGKEIAAPAVKHGSQVSEWAAFRAACRLHDRAGHESISMGAGQVMGFNFARAGYSTPQEMFAALSVSEVAQLHAVAGFLRDPPILAATRAKNWLQMARLYNGKGQVGYDKKLAAAYAAQIAKG